MGVDCPFLCMGLLFFFKNPKTTKKLQKTTKNAKKIRKQQKKPEKKAFLLCSGVPFLRVWELCPLVIESLTALWVFVMGLLFIILGSLFSGPSCMGF